MIHLLKILYCKPKARNFDIEEQIRNLVITYSYENTSLQTGRYITQAMADKYKEKIIKYRFVENKFCKNSNNFHVFV